MMQCGNLERSLSDGKFTVTTEIGPPKGCDIGNFRSKADLLKGHATAFNVTDNQTAVVRLSSLSGSVFLLKMGLEPILQITCRDRNRIAIQSDLLGASALGIRNVLCLTGDHQSFGNHPQSMGVYDIDSIQLIKILKDMRDEGIFQNKEEIPHGKPQFFIGAAANPFSDPIESRVDRLEKKVDAGVDFIQTQSVFNIEKFQYWMDEIRARQIDKKVHILAGITPLKSVKMTERMQFHVPGVDLPIGIADRIKKAEDPKKEGFNISLDLIEKIKDISGIHGIHITALFWEQIIPSIVKESSLIFL